MNRTKNNQTVKMDKNKLMQELANAGIIATLAALVRALMTKNETLLQKVKIFTAGVCVGVLLAILLLDAPLKEFWKEVFIAVSSAFVSTLWPQFEIFVLKLFKKKTDAIIKNDDIS